MPRRLLIVSCLLGLGFIAFAQVKQKAKSNEPVEKINYKLKGAPLPSLKIFTKEGKYLTEKDLQNDAHLILMLFNPTCEHCEDQAGIFKDNIFLFKKSKLVLIAGAMMVPHLGYFVNNTRIQDYPTIQVGVDSSGYIDQTFYQESLPQINIYDKDRRLERIFFGNVPIDSLKAYIE